MLTALATILIFIHSLGAMLGAGGITYAEVFYTKAVADGHVDRKERDYFARSYFALRYGMTTVLLTGLALIIVQYFLPNSPDEVLYAPLWMQNTLALIVTFAAWALSRDFIPWWAGSSIAFAGWWMLLILDAFALFPIPYLFLLFVFVIAVFVSAAFWGYARVWAHEHVKMKK
jgi:hypothetical protein